jgi:Ni/Co efflux regulator RcnB
MTIWPKIWAALALATAATSAGMGPPLPAHAQARHLWRRGETLPAEVLRAGPDVNYAAQRLRRPPDGFGWFTLDGAFLLASLSSGLIVDVAD